VGKCLTQEAKFLVLNKKSAWDRGLAINVDTSEDGLQISKTVAYVFDRENEIDVLSDTFAVQDFAVAQCSQLYILDSATPSIWIYDTNEKTIEKIDCIGALFRKPTSITYIAGTLYVADSAAEQRIYGLAEVNWQIRFAIGDHPKNPSLPLLHPFAPIDLAVDSDRNLFALDANNLAILKFNDTAQLSDVFGQSELKDKTPSSIALSRDGILYVLDPLDRKVWQFPTRRTGPVLGSVFIDFKTPAVSKNLPAEFTPSGFAIDSTGTLYIGDKGTGPEDDRFIRKFDSEGNYRGVVEDFRGAVDQLVVDLNNSIFVFRAEEKNKIIALRREQRFAQLESGSLVKGRYVSLALDSTDAGTIWHKLSSRTILHANTQVQISFLAADDKRLKIGQNEEDLDNFLSATATLDVTSGGGRIDKQNRLADLDKLSWSRPVVNSSEALIAAEGRYLWTRIDLIGTEQLSPSVHSLRVDYPRISYLRYLPAVYQEDERGRDFLERFLSLFETFFAGIETQVDHISRYFDPDSSSARGEFLRWLSTWLAISVDNTWDDEKLRRLVKRASQIYQYRGTRAAIEEMIEIFTGDLPLIVEHHQTSCTAWFNQKLKPEFAEVKAFYERLYGSNPFCFCVLLKPFPVTTEEQRQAVLRILDLEKPAHTCAGLLTLQPWVQLDTHTYLEINTYLSQPSARINTSSAMPRDTVLNALEQTGQLERRSRINLDIKLT
jgi:phage tail-like protein